VRYLSPRKGQLQQGELLARIWEHRANIPPTEQSEGATFGITSLLHDFMVVMSPDCDLEWDFFLRFPDSKRAVSYDPVPNIESAGKYLPHVLLCDAYPDDVLRATQDMNKRLWRNILSNQDQRFHHLPSGAVGSARVTPLPELVLDFKKPLTIPTSMVYEGVRLYRVRRLGVIPPVYLHDLVQRFFGFLSRVALPD
jgi:hypothetical protein